MVALHWGPPAAGGPARAGLGWAWVRGAAVGLGPPPGECISGGGGAEAPGKRLNRSPVFLSIVCPLATRKSCIVRERWWAGYRGDRSYLPLFSPFAVIDVSAPDAPTTIALRVGFQPSVARAYPRGEKISFVRKCIHKLSGTTQLFTQLRTNWVVLLSFVRICVHNVSSPARRKRPSFKQAPPCPRKSSLLLAWAPDQW